MIRRPVPAPPAWTTRRRECPPSNGHDVPLAAVFQLAVREEGLGALTVSYKGKTIVLTPDQALASVAGRLVSLPVPPVRSGGRWLVPVDFIGFVRGVPAARTLT